MRPPHGTRGHHTRPLHVPLETQDWSKVTKCREKVQRSSRKVIALWSKMEKNTDNIAIQSFIVPRANGRASGPVLQSVFLAVIDHSARHKKRGREKYVPWQSMDVWVATSQRTARNPFANVFMYLSCNVTVTKKGGGGRWGEIMLFCNLFLLFWHVKGPAWHVKGLTWHVRGPVSHRSLDAGTAWHIKGPAWHVMGPAWPIRRPAWDVKEPAFWVWDPWFLSRFLPTWLDWLCPRDRSALLGTGKRKSSNNNWRLTIIQKKRRKKSSMLKFNWQLTKNYRQITVDKWLIAKSLLFRCDYASL